MLVVLSASCQGPCGDILYFISGFTFKSQHFQQSQALKLSFQVPGKQHFKESLRTALGNPSVIYVLALFSSFGPAAVPGHARL